MGYGVKIMPRAQRDLAAIYDQISAEESDAASIWYSGLKNAVRSLDTLPGRSPTTPEDNQLKRLLDGHKPHVYRVIYRILESQKPVEVLHIRHGARQKFGLSEL